MDRPRREVQLRRDDVGPPMARPQDLSARVHPPESPRRRRAALPIRQFPFAELLVVPLVQHIGKPALPWCARGQEVTRGQRIAEPDGFHVGGDARTGLGRVIPSLWVPGIRRRMVPAVYLEPFPRLDPGGRSRAACPLERTPETDP